MKPYIIALFLIITTSAIAQSEHIDYFKILNEGKDISIKTKSANIKKKGQEILMLSLMYETVMIENPKMSGFSLFITFYSYRENTVIPLNGKLLIRTCSGKVISLQQSVPDDLCLFDPETGFKTNHQFKSEIDHTDQNDNKFVYIKFGKYPISEEDLKSIINEGLVKLRIETTGESLEYEYPVEEKVRVNGKAERRNIVSSTLLPYYNTLLETINPRSTF